MLILEFEETQQDGNTLISDYAYKTNMLTEEDMKIVDLEGYEIDSKTQKYLTNF
ncbi:MAG: hypothetical protein HFJ52_01625 [Clostridia bacterium]|jgi:hypothetical protein|nr:hypothetical protein [Clostridia bacterium]